MKHSEVKRLNEKCRKASGDFDAYNTTAKEHTITMSGQTMTAQEMISGHIKINGSEEFKSFVEMLECLASDAKIETVEL